MYFWKFKYLIYHFFKSWVHFCLVHQNLDIISDKNSLIKYQNYCLTLNNRLAYPPTVFFLHGTKGRRQWHTYHSIEYRNSTWPTVNSYNTWILCLNDFHIFWIRINKENDNRRSRTIWNIRLLNSINWNLDPQLTCQTSHALMNKSNSDLVSKNKYMQAIWQCHFC